jgi:hypothetical protein
MNDEDREVMEVDEAYHTSVTQAGVRRIATLPADLNLAAPHLYSAEEVRAHVLIQKFEFGQGQDELKKADREVDLTRAARKVKRQLAAAEVRAKLPEERTKEEKEWVSIDRLLRPQLYPFDSAGSEPCLVDPELDAEAVRQIAARWRAGLDTEAQRRVWDLVYKCALSFLLFSSFSWVAVLCRGTRVGVLLPPCSVALQLRVVLVLLALALALGLGLGLALALALALVLALALALALAPGLHKLQH